MKTLEQFLSDYLGKSVGYPVGKYNGECLSIVKLYIKECFGIDPPASGNGSAYGYWSNFPEPLCKCFEKVENTPELIPQKGWIAIWKPWKSNPYGHIAIVDDGCTKSVLVNDAQNWGTRIFRKLETNYDNVIGYLKPFNSIIEDNMTDKEKTILGLINENKLSEGDVRWLVDLKKNQTVPNLEKKVEELDTSVVEIKTQLDDLASKYANNEKELKLYQSSLKTANQTISNLKEELETINKERTQFKSWYESKCKELKEATFASQKFNIFDFIKLLINPKK